LMLARHELMKKHQQLAQARQNQARMSLLMQLLHWKLWQMLSRLLSLSTSRGSARAAQITRLWSVRQMQGQAPAQAFKLLTKTVLQLLLLLLTQKQQPCWLPVSQSRTSGTGSATAQALQTSRQLTWLLHPLKSQRQRRSRESQHRQQLIFQQSPWL